MATAQWGGTLHGKHQGLSINLLRSGRWKAPSQNTDTEDLWALSEKWTQQIQTSNPTDKTSVPSRNKKYRTPAIQSILYMLADGDMYENKL